MIQTGCGRRRIRGDEDPSTSPTATAAVTVDVVTRRPSETDDPEAGPSGWKKRKACDGEPDDGDSVKRQKKKHFGCCSKYTNFYNSI